MTAAENNPAIQGLAIRVRGVVQGVGFRPTVWRLAHECNIRGAVWNDSEGVMIHAWASPLALDEFIARITGEPPPLARVEHIERQHLDSGDIPQGFDIIASHKGQIATEVSADAATCPDCLREVLDPINHRYRYPFTNCTHCGPRLSIVNAIPYDRAHTSMAAFAMCPACQAEYDDSTDRRFHAQPNACPQCGPRLWLEDAKGKQIECTEDQDSIATAHKFIEDGAIIAIKGIGGIHLACDACNETAVKTLRQRKHRYHKAFALMASDINMILQYAEVNDQERTLLQDRAAPIVVLKARGRAVAESVAPGQNTLGFMLPYTPLHHLLMQDMKRPIILTSGNRSDEPQCIDNKDARERLQGIADYGLLHDRDIVNRLDDSVVRVAASKPRMLRRARGYAPASLPLPKGFAQAPPILAMGGELKNTFCLLQNGKAILSQHIGDLEDAATHHDYRHNLSLYRRLFEHKPKVITVDLHPDYLSTQTGRLMAEEEKAELIEVQHHHAHIAACMFEHNLPIDTERVLGIALDGLGFGDDDTLWGGEFLVADYNHYQRMACFQPVPMLGGAKAMYEPWRNTYAHLLSALGWETVNARYAETDIVKYLNAKPLDTLQTMCKKGLNSPLASSCGRLFDAVAAAIGVCREAASYEGQAAVELEALAMPVFKQEHQKAYPFDCEQSDDIITLSWPSLWQALLHDVAKGIDGAVIAARFHHGLARAVADTAIQICKQREIKTVVLSGGVFQNRLLLEEVNRRLEASGNSVLIPEKFPANDGGIALGQAAIAATMVLSFTARTQRVRRS